VGRGAATDTHASRRRLLSGRPRRGTRQERAGQTDGRRHGMTRYDRELFKALRDARGPNGTAPGAWNIQQTFRSQWPGRKPPSTREIASRMRAMERRRWVNWMPRLNGEMRYQPTAEGFKEFLEATAAARR
jgi:hypothetical protein